MEKIVLIVDDEPDLRFTLADILRALGYTVRIASNGREAMESIRTYGPPSVLVLDLMMPVMDGYKLWSELHRDPVLAKIPIIVISAGIAINKDEIDLFGVVSKPIRLPLLCNLIDKAIETRLADRALAGPGTLSSCDSPGGS